MKEFFKGVMHMTIEEMKEKKREHGYTYNMMSQMSGVPLGTVQKIFTGETRIPEQHTRQRFRDSIRWMIIMRCRRIAG